MNEIKYSKNCNQFTISHRPPTPVEVIALNLEVLRKSKTNIITSKVVDLITGEITYETKEFHYDFSSSNYSNDIITIWGSRKYYDYYLAFHKRKFKAYIGKLDPYKIPNWNKIIGLDIDEILLKHEELKPLLEHYKNYETYK